jgi:flavin-dependent dehydrogenase
LRGISVFDIIVSGAGPAGAGRDRAARKAARADADARGSAPKLWRRSIWRARDARRLGMSETFL